MPRRDRDRRIAPLNQSTTATIPRRRRHFRAVSHFCKDRFPEAAAPTRQGRSIFIAWRSLAAENQVRELLQQPPVLLLDLRTAIDFITKADRIQLVAPV